MLQRIRQYRRKTAGILLSMMVLSLLTFSSLTCMAAGQSDSVVMDMSHGCCAGHGPGSEQPGNDCGHHCLATGMDSGADLWTANALDLQLPVVIVSALVLELHQVADTHSPDHPLSYSIPLIPEEHRVLRI